MDNITWSTTPLTTQDMLNLLLVRSMGAGLTPENYAACIALVASRARLDVAQVLALPADDLILLMGPCMESVSDMLASDALLRQTFGA